jgi:hypothetical protein
LNADKLELLNNKVMTESKAINAITDEIIKANCEDLDNYMLFISNILKDETNPPTDLELDDFVLNLPLLMYFTGINQESLGIKEDVIKSIKQNAYSNAYDLAIGQVAARKVEAEDASQNEALLLSAYQRAYKKMKVRMETAQEMLNSVKKVVSRRMAEYEISRTPK